MSRSEKALALLEKWVDVPGNCRNAAWWHAWQSALDEIFPPTGRDIRIVQAEHDLTAAQGSDP